MGAFCLLTVKNLYLAKIIYYFCAIRLFYDKSVKKGLFFDIVGVINGSKKNRIQSCFGETQNGRGRGHQEYAPTRHGLPEQKGICRRSDEIHPRILFAGTQQNMLRTVTILWRAIISDTMTIS